MTLILFNVLGIMGGACFIAMAFMVFRQAHYGFAVFFGLIGVLIPLIFILYLAPSALQYEAQEDARIASETYDAYARRVVFDSGIAFTTENLNLRTGPGVDHSRVLTAPKGSRLTVLPGSGTGKWLRVSFRGTEGWVSARYVRAAMEREKEDAIVRAVAKHGLRFAFPEKTLLGRILGFVLGILLSLGLGALLPEAAEGLEVGKVMLPAAYFIGKSFLIGDLSVVEAGVLNWVIFGIFGLVSLLSVKLGEFLRESTS